MHNYFSFLMRYLIYCSIPWRAYSKRTIWNHLEHWQLSNWHVNTAALTVFVWKALMARSDIVHQTQMTIPISPDLLKSFLDEFDDGINSKRLKSRITTIEDLIQILSNRNLLHSDQSIMKITKYFSNNEQRKIVREYIHSLYCSVPVGNPRNIYGMHFL